MHEIITLQLGNYANYVGAHFWNLQDEALGYSSHEQWGSVASCIDHDVLHTWSEDRQGHATSHPRAVVLDLSGALGGVTFSRDAGSPAAAAIAAASGHVATWAGGVALARTPAIPKSAFTQQLEQQAALDPDEATEEQLGAQQAALEAAARQLGNPEGGVRYWTDYLKAQFQPGSSLTLPGMWQGAQPFEGFGEGAAMAGATEIREQLADRVRLFAEDCDQLQGFQLLADDLSGFGGLSVRLLQELRDDYPNRPLMYYALRRTGSNSGSGAGAVAGASSLASTRDALSEALSWAEVAELASLYIPLAAPLPGAGNGLPALRWSPGSPFHCSALLAAALDCATLPLRLTGASSALGPSIGATNMHSLVQLLTGRGGARCAAMGMQLPAGCLPSSLHAAGERRDERMSHGMQNGSAGAASHGPGSSGSSVAAASSSSGYDLSVQGAAMLCPGLRTAASDDCLAESITLRGARLRGQLASSLAAATALDAVLLVEGRRCVQHRCIAPMPLAVPLPFPHMFAPSVVSYQGEVGSPVGSSSGSGSSTAAGAAAASGGPGEVATCPVLTRLLASSAFESLILRQEQQLARGAASVAGAQLLSRWGYASADTVELRERLVHMAGSYTEEEDGI